MTLTNKLGPLALLAAEVVDTDVPNGPAMHRVERTRRLDLNPEKPEIPCSRCNGTCIRDDIRYVGRQRGRHVYLVTCIGCRTVQRIESDRALAHRPEVPAGEARNAPCPCGSGKKSKKCHPAGVV